MEKYPSRTLFKEGFYLTGSVITWFSANYLAGADDTDPRSAPNLYEDLSGLPPATVITAGFDPLRDEGEAYAARLKEAGVTVKKRCCDQMVHGFISMGGIIDAAAHGVADMAEEFRREMTS